MSSQSDSTSFYTGFDYGELKSETRLQVQQWTNEIQGLVRRSAQDIIEIGQKLLDVKCHLGHGSFGTWLKAEFDWSHDIANKFMSVARRFGHSSKFSELAPSALYVLAAPSTPEAAVSEVLEMAEHQEKPTFTEVKAIVERHKHQQAVKPKSGPPPKRALQITSKPQHQESFGPSASLARLVAVPQSEPAKTSSKLLSDGSEVVAVKPAVNRGDQWQLDRHLVYCQEMNLSSVRRLVPSPAALAFIHLPWNDVFHWSYDWLINHAQVVAVLLTESVDVGPLLMTTQMPQQFGIGTIIGGTQWGYLSLFSHQDLGDPPEDIRVASLEELMVCVVQLFSQTDETIIVPRLPAELPVVCQQHSRRLIAGEPDPVAVSQAFTVWWKRIGQLPVSVLSSQSIALA